MGTEIVKTLYGYSKYSNIYIILIKAKVMKYNGSDEYAKLTDINQTLSILL